eukprot:4612253-Amphidinium_carterae.2
MPDTLAMGVGYRNCVGRHYTRLVRTRRCRLHPTSGAARKARLLMSAVAHLKFQGIGDMACHYCVRGVVSAILLIPEDVAALPHDCMKGTNGSMANRAESVGAPLLAPRATPKIKPRNCALVKALAQGRRPISISVPIASWSTMFAAESGRGGSTAVLGVASLEGESGIGGRSQMGPCTIPSQITTELIPKTISSCKRSVM